MSKAPALTIRYHTRSGGHALANGHTLYHAVISDNTSAEEYTTFYLAKQLPKPITQPTCIYETISGHTVDATDEFFSCQIKTPKLYLKDAKYVTFKKDKQ